MHIRLMNVVNMTDLKKNIHFGKSDRKLVLRKCGLSRKVADTLFS